MRCRIIPIAAHRPTRLRRTGTIPSTASIFLTQRVRGWGLGGTPTRHHVIQRDETHAVPAWNLFEPAAPRRRSAALHCQSFGLATLPRAGTP